jgi:hypothetical protein
MSQARRASQRVMRSAAGAKNYQTSLRGLLRSRASRVIANQVECMNDENELRVKPP